MKPEKYDKPKKINNLTTASRPPDDDPMRKFSKAKAIAQRVGVCAKTISRWGKSGRIDCYKVNARVVLFDDAQVDALIQSSRVA